MRRPGAGRTSSDAEGSAPVAADPSAESVESVLGDGDEQVICWVDIVPARQPPEAVQP